MQEQIYEIITGMLGGREKVVGRADGAAVIINLLPPHGSHNQTYSVGIIRGGVDDYGAFMVVAAGDNEPKVFSVDEDDKQQPASEKELQELLSVLDGTTA